jgi:hypothetical protein
VIRAQYDLASARALRAKQAAKQAAIASEFQNWRPTPSRAEGNETALTHEPVLLKRWDLSPIDMGSFDPTEPPGRPGAPLPPANTVLPSVSGPNLRVGTELMSSTGAWTGDPSSYARQWRCEAEDLEGETGVTYIVDLADVGLHLSVRVTASNSAGSSSATSLEVGPVPAPLARAEPISHG